MGTLPSQVLASSFQLFYATSQQYRYTTSRDPQIKMSPMNTHYCTRPVLRCYHKLHCCVRPILRCFHKNPYWIAIPRPLLLVLSQVLGQAIQLSPRNPLRVQLGGHYALMHDLPDVGSQPTLSRSHVLPVAHCGLGMCACVRSRVGGGCMLACLRVFCMCFAIISSVPPLQ